MLEEDRQKLDKIYTFFFESPVKDSPTRAQQMDQVLFAARITRFSFRAAFYIAAAVTAFSAAWSEAKGWMPK